MRGVAVNCERVRNELTRMSLAEKRARAVKFG